MSGSRTRKKKSLQKNLYESASEGNREESGNADYAIGSILIYTLTGLVIALIASYFWWAGLVLFLFFALYSLIELLLNGFVVGLVILIVYFALKYAQRMGFRLKNFDRAKEQFKKVAQLSSALIAANLVLILVLFSLGYYLFAVIE